MSIRGGESGKIFSDACNTEGSITTASIPCIANQQKEYDAVCSDNHYHSDKFQSADDNVPSTYLDGQKEEDDASSVIIIPMKTMMTTLEN
ncbi:hypothetical protein MKW92_017895 [Papaver armeniacum]|nr:hypothetical protein MKW92_017895 [Papaver armeniacum]